MGNLSIWFVIAGAVIVCRALSFSVIAWEMYILREGMCIKRIVHEQKACDFLIGIYHFLVVLIGLWLMIMGGWEVFHNSEIPSEISMGIPFWLLVLFVLYFGLYIYLNTGYDLTSFYNDMIDYRSKQEVVTKDNDNEVSFIRSFKRVKKHIWYATVWAVLLIIAMIVFQIVLY